LGEDNFERAYLSHKGMPEAMMVWTMSMKDLEEMLGTREEMLQDERKRERKQKRKKTKERAERAERKRMRNYADALRPWQSPIAKKPSAKITTKRPNITTRNTNTTKNNTTTTTRTTSRKGIAISASNCTSEAIQPGHQGTADGRRKCSYEGSNEQETGRSRSP
jgi:hypothetical protein